MLTYHAILALVIVATVFYAVMLMLIFGALAFIAWNVWVFMAGLKGIDLRALMLNIFSTTAKREEELARPTFSGDF